MRTPDAARLWCGAVMCGVVLAGCSAAATSTETQSPAGGASTPPPAVASDHPAAVHSSTGLEGVTLNAIADSGEGMVAVGAGAGAGAWMSTPRVTGHTVEIAGADDADALHAVAIDGDGVAFGAVDPDPSRAWSATSGSQSWEPADSSGIDGRVNAVAAGGGRWVAAGDLVDPETGTATAGAVWTSDDGRRWKSLAEPPLNEGTVSDVIIADDMVVVVGFDIDGGKMWTSTDGADLQAVDGGDFAAATIQGVAHTDAGYVALGRALGDLRPVVWTSDDAVVWDRQDASIDVFAPDLQINDLATVDGALVAVGTAPEGGAVWTSQDGASWTLYAPGAASEPVGATDNGS